MRALPLVLFALVSACVGRPAGESSSTISGLVIEAPTKQLALGATVKLSAWELLSSGEKQAARAQWHSRSPEIVSIEAGGVARAVTRGRAIIDASTETHQATIELEVGAAELHALAIFPSDLESVPLGSTITLRAAGSFSDGSAKDVAAQGDWRAEGATQVGQAQFRFDTLGPAAVSIALGSKRATKVFRVTAPVVASLEVTADQAGLRTEETSRVSVLARWTDGTSRVVTGNAVLSTVDSSIAVVRGGLLVALTPGLTRVVAEYEGVSGSAPVSVVDRVVVGLNSTIQSVDLPLGRTVRLQIIATFDDGSAREVTDELTWTNAEPGITDVDASGTIRAIGQGSTQLEARFGGQTISVTVTGHAPVLDSLRLSWPSDRTTRLVVGQLASFAVLGRFSDGTELNLSPLASFEHSQHVTVILWADALEIEALTAGAAFVDVSVSGFAKTLPLELSTEAISSVRVEYASDGPRRLIAIATYADGLQADVTEQCEWQSSNPAGVTVGSAAGQRGHLLSERGASTVSASVLHRTATIDLAR